MRSGRGRGTREEGVSLLSCPPLPFSLLSSLFTPETPYTQTTLRCHKSMNRIKITDMK